MGVWRVCKSAKVQNCKDTKNAVKFLLKDKVEKKLRTKTDNSFVRFCPGLDFYFFDRHTSLVDWILVLKWGIKSGVVMQ